MSVWACLCTPYGCMQKPEDGSADLCWKPVFVIVEACEALNSWLCSLTHICATRRSHPSSLWALRTGLRPSISHAKPPGWCCSTVSPFCPSRNCHSSVPCRLTVSHSNTVTQPSLKALHSLTVKSQKATRGILARVQSRPLSLSLKSGLLVLWPQV